jgi:hypothetical protein
MSLALFFVPRRSEQSFLAAFLAHNKEGNYNRHFKCMELKTPNKLTFQRIQFHTQQILDCIIVKLPLNRIIQFNG